MKPKHRLGAIVKLREQEEEKARLDLADARQKIASATAVQAAAATRARRDDRRRGAASDWEIADLAQSAALREARQAELAVASAAQHLARKLADFVGVHGRTEALRRVVKTRAEEQQRELEAGEGKALDEIAVFRHAHTRQIR
jgi:hypothetical protein